MKNSQFEAQRRAEATSFRQGLRCFAFTLVTTPLAWLILNWLREFDSLCCGAGPLTFIEVLLVLAYPCLGVLWGCTFLIKSAFARSTRRKIVLIPTLLVWLYAYGITETYSASLPELGSYCLSAQIRGPLFGPTCYSVLWKKFWDQHKRNQAPEEA